VEKFSWDRIYDVFASDRNSTEFTLEVLPESRHRNFDRAQLMQTGGAGN